MSAQLTAAGLMVGFILREEVRERIVLCEPTRPLGLELIVRPPAGIKITVSKRSGGRATVVDESGGRLFTVWDSGNFSFREEAEENTDPHMKQAMAVLLKPIAEVLSGRLFADPAEAETVNLDILSVATERVSELLRREQGKYRAFLLDYGFYVEDAEKRREVLSGTRYGDPGSGEWSFHPDPDALPAPTFLLS